MSERILTITLQPDWKAGHEVAKRTCFVCHKLHGEGSDVGPDLTGVGRSTLAAYDRRNFQQGLPFLGLSLWRRQNRWAVARMVAPRQLGEGYVVMQVFQWR